MLVGISVAIVVLVVILTIFFVFSRQSKPVRTKPPSEIIIDESSEKPIISVCETEERVGVVLRSDYDAAWTHDPHNILVRHVFVFHPNSEAYKRLRSECRVERANFEVPPWPRGTEEQEFQSAYRRFFKKEP